MMNKNCRLLCGLLLIATTACTTIKNTTPSMEIRNGSSIINNGDSLLLNLLRSQPQYFGEILKNEAQYRVQIIYTQIDRGANGMPVLKHHYFNLKPDQYFYPASTVKLPGALLALQKLNELNMPGLNRNTTMITEAGAPGQTAVYNDPSAADGRPTIANYIKKIFLVSDNDAYNRLYEFLGQRYLNQSLHKLGYDSVQLLHRLQISLTEEQNRATNPVSFYDGTGQMLYQQPLLKSSLVYQPRRTVMGKGYISGDKLVNSPFDFSAKNRISLSDLHSILQTVVLPESVPAKQRFKLTEDDYRFLYKYMSMKPRESRFPQYDSTYGDAYGKFLLFGGKDNKEKSSIRIFNKIGDAYGFLNDVAYVVDFDNGVEFMLSATIYCNSDGIFNDDKYDYETIGIPFLKHLGEAVYAYELQRTKKYKPDLSKFRIDYKDGGN